MKKVFIIIALLLGFGCQEVRAESVDVSNLFVTLHFPANWQQKQRFTEIRSWFETDLQELKLNARAFNVYEEGTEFFNQKYAGRVTVPSILIQEPDGDIVFAATANNIPKTSDVLISKINTRLAKYSTQLPYRNPYNRDCVDCKPMPEPEPMIEFEIAVDEPVIDEPEESSYLNLLLVLIGGAALSFYTNKRSEGN